LLWECEVLQEAPPGRSSTPGRADGCFLSCRATALARPGGKSCRSSAGAPSGRSSTPGTSSRLSFLRSTDSFTTRGRCQWSSAATRPVEPPSWLGAVDWQEGRRTPPVRELRSPLKL
ncbi:unnamed protein product, partial [Ectocarpus sp. 13 AM-2016]